MLNHFPCDQATPAVMWTGSTFSPGSTGASTGMPPNLRTRQQHHLNQCCGCGSKYFEFGFESMFKLYIFFVNCHLPFESLNGEFMSLMIQSYICCL